MSENQTFDPLTSRPKNWEQAKEYNSFHDRRQKDLFESRKYSPEEIAYANRIRTGEKKKYSRDDAKIIFMDQLCKAIVTGFETLTESKKIEQRNRIKEIIKNDLGYSQACAVLLDLAFGFENNKLEGKGGVYLFSAPGVGKTTIMAAAGNIMNYCNNVSKNPTSVIWQVMRSDISKKLTGKEIDLTYNHTSNLFLDELTEKINQVSHYGDYKYSLNEVIQNRYELWKSKGLITVIGTNIHKEDLFELIDERSRTRFNEQYLVLNLLGKNKRTK